VVIIAHTRLLGIISGVAAAGIEIATVQPAGGIVPTGRTALNCALAPQTPTPAGSGRYDGGGGRWGEAGLSPGYRSKDPGYQKAMTQGRQDDLMSSTRKQTSPYYSASTTLRDPHEIEFPPASVASLGSKREAQASRAHCFHQRSLVRGVH
jgi:hypothetical protein